MKRIGERKVEWENRGRGVETVLCLVSEVATLNFLDVRRLSSKLEFLGVVSLLLGTVRSPGSGPPSGDFGEVELVNLSERETTSFRNESPNIDGEEGNSSGPEERNVSS